MTGSRRLHLSQVGSLWSRPCPCGTSGILKLRKNGQNVDNFIVHGRVASCWQSWPNCNHTTWVYFHPRLVNVRGVAQSHFRLVLFVLPDEMCGSQHGKFQSIPVSSNDLVYDRHGVSTGEIDIRIPGSSGKHRCFRDLAIMARETAGDSEHTGVSMSGQRSLTVFVGDSVTDLLAMLDADIGIVVGSSGTFAKVATAFGIPIRPLAAAHEALGGKRGETCDRGLSEPDNCIYRVSNWAEIDAFLFGGA